MKLIQLLEASKMSRNAAIEVLSPANRWDCLSVGGKDLKPNQLTKDNVIKGLLERWRRLVNGDVKNPSRFITKMITAAEALGYGGPELDTIKRSVYKVNSDVGTEKITAAIKLARKLGYGCPELDAFEKVVKEKFA